MKRSLVIGLALAAVLISPVAVEAISVSSAPRPASGITSDPICIFNHSDPSCISTTPLPSAQWYDPSWAGHYRWSSRCPDRSIDPNFLVPLPDRSGDHWWVVTPWLPDLDPHFFGSAAPDNLSLCLIPVLQMV